MILFSFALVSALCTLYVVYSNTRRLLELKRKTALEISERTTPLSYEQHGVSHLAVIMDGNRRYGKVNSTQVPTNAQQSELTALCSSLSGRPKGAATAQWVRQQYSMFLSLIQCSALDGHRLGGEKLMDFIVYCIEMEIPMLTVYAFSTDNWSRPSQEVDVLISLFFFFFDRIRRMSETYGIFIRFISTQPERLPRHVLELMKEVECESRHHHPRRITVNVCVSYSGQTEVLAACNRLLEKRLHTAERAPVTKEELGGEMLRSVTQADFEGEDASVFSSPSQREPQLMLRTSGEQRISNFLLYESAYTEFVFVEKTWPEITKHDLIHALGQYAKRDKRMGK
ncbi:undecaprenyl diphosphate synthase [Strigomonas culicis]|nr:undecaprenyl diphosphate synthase [Strigomonas culicis]|eukprot:EPY34317.1 undecaprenyl diphosphate synthase [Strigomonas culicis]